MKPVIRTYQVDNPLTQAMAAPGGVTIAEALSRAAAGVEEVRATCMEALDAKIAEIGAVTAGAAFSASAADMARIYTLANEILSEAGVFGLSELSEAGRSLCELTSSWREGGVELEPIRVHVAAMCSLRRSDVAGAPDLRAAVVQGLRAVTAKVSAQARRA
jgi:hypothetical protein